jgi:hypothetical protein
MPLEVRTPGQMEAVFERIAKELFDRDLARCLIATLLVNPFSGCPFSPPHRRRRILVVSAVGPAGRRTMRLETRPRHVERAVR